MFIFFSVRRRRRHDEYTSITDEISIEEVQRINLANTRRNNVLDFEDEEEESESDFIKKSKVSEKISLGEDEITQTEDDVYEDEEEDEDEEEEEEINADDEADDEFR